MLGPPPFPAAMFFANSLMSAPAMKVRPPPMITIAWVAGFDWAASIAASRPFGDAGTQGVHGRVVDGDQGHGAVIEESYEFGH